VNWEGKAVNSKRLAYVLTNGDVPEGTRLKAQCSTKGCIRPEHMKQKGEPGYQAAHSTSLKPAKERSAEKVRVTILEGNPRLQALIDLTKEMTSEVSKNDEDHKRALIRCSEARDAMDATLLHISKAKGELDAIAEALIPVYREEDFIRFAKEGKRLRKEADKDE
jgi:hypothetical protein